MSAPIEVSKLNYNTNNGTISSVLIKIGLQWFRVEFKDHKYIVINIGDTLGKNDANPIASDKNPAIEPKAVTPVVGPKTVTPVVEPKAVTPVVEPKATADSKSFKDNDELILKLIDNGFTHLNTPDTGTPPMHLGLYEEDDSRRGLYEHDRGTVSWDQRHQ